MAHVSRFGESGVGGVEHADTPSVELEDQALGRVDVGAVALGCAPARR